MEKRARSARLRRRRRMNGQCTARPPRTRNESSVFSSQLSDQSPQRRTRLRHPACRPDPENKKTKRSQRTPPNRCQSAKSAYSPPKKVPNEAKLGKSCQFSAISCQTAPHTPATPRGGRRPESHCLPKEPNDATGDPARKTPLRWRAFAPLSRSLPASGGSLRPYPYPPRLRTALPLAILEPTGRTGKRMHPDRDTR
jgi:hypothetical protein